MLDHQFVKRLKEFLVLENAQVAFYRAQANSAADEYYGYVFKRLGEIEQKHVQFFTSVLEKIGESVPSLINSTVTLGSKLLGESVELNGKDKTCSLGAKFESKAIEHYTSFIDECKQKKYTVIQESLMEFRLDEEFHKLWLQDYAKNHPE